MKIIFLDIDGVLNCDSTAERVPNTLIIGIDPKLLANLKTLVDTTGAVVVLSSSWRLMRDMFGNSSNKLYQYLEEQLANVGISIYDQIDRDISESYRGLLIKHWMYDENVEAFVILDDDCFDYEKQGLKDNWVHTTYDKGFTERKLQDALNILKRSPPCLKELRN